MYPAESKHRYLLQALASDGSALDELIDFLSSRKAEYEELLRKSAIAALDDKTRIPYALRQQGGVDALDDLIFTFRSYAKTRSKK